MTTRRIMRSLTIKEISGVDRPAQEGARKTLLKRADKIEVQCGDELLKAAYALAEAPPPGGAKDFATLLAEDEAQRRECDVDNQMWPLFCALRESLTSIVADPALEQAAKLEMIRRSVEAFMNEVADQVPDVEAQLTKIFTALISKGNSAGDPAGDHVRKKENPMSDETKKVADLEKSVTDLTAELKIAKSMAELSDTEKAHHAALSAEDGAKFLALSKDERGKAVAKAAESNAVVYKAEDGTEYRKSDDPRLVSLAKKADEDAKVLKAEREARATAEFAKRAETEFSHVAGTTDEKAQMLKAIAGIADEKVRTSIDAVLKANEAMLKAGFNRIGHGNSQVAEGSAEAQLEKKAKDYAKANKVTYAEAYGAVCDAEPALYDQAISEKGAAAAH